MDNNEIKSDDTKLQSQQGEELPPKPEIEEKPKRRGRPKGNKPKSKIEKIDIQIPFTQILVNLTIALAERLNNEKYIMTLEEATNIENGFNYWLEARLPLLSQYYPEIVLITPVLAYGMRVMMTPSKPIIEKKK